MSLWPLRYEGRPGSERAGERHERDDVIDVDASAPPPSASTSSIRRLRIAAHRTGAVASVLGKRKAAGPTACGCGWFPLASEVGPWARERLHCGEWDAWARNLPIGPPSLL